MRFKDKTGYQKWLAFGHMHSVFEHTPGNQQIFIKGKRHKVNHRG